MSEQQEQPTEQKKSQPKTSGAKKPASTKAKPDTTVIPQEEPTPVKTNDSLFHLPFIAVLIVLGIAGTTLVNAGLNSGKTDQQIQQLETEYRGYRDGVKDAN